MSLIKTGGLLLAAFGTASAQIIQVGSYNFDVDGCVAHQDVYNGYLAAQQDYFNTVNNYCNNPTVTAASQRGNCIIAASSNFGQMTLGHMWAGCWNRALSCEFQLATAAFRFDEYSGSTGSNGPAVSPNDYMDVPGSCVCNIPLAVTLILETPVSRCFVNQPPDETTCECCFRAASLAQLQDLCPNNSYEPLGLSDYIARTVQDTQSNCGGLVNANWSATLHSACPVNDIPTVAGFINPLSIPSDWPQTTPLSNIPGSVTDLAQYKITETALTWSWNEFETATYVYSPYNAAAAATTGAEQAIGSVADSSGALAPTTGVSVMSGVVPTGADAPKTTAAATTGATTPATTGTNTATTGATTPGTTGTNTASAATTSKTSGADRLSVPGVIGLLSMFMLL